MSTVHRGPQAAYPNSKNTNSYIDGMEFQDLVVEEFNKLGFYIQLHASKKYQYERGESVQMAEIKLDKRCLETGQLSIEVGERTSVDKEWVYSGIYRKDNTIFYVQGNKDRIYLFDRKVLRQYYKETCKSTYKESPREGPTVRKFYMPLEHADELCILRVPSLPALRRKKTLATVQEYAPEEASQN